MLYYTNFRYILLTRVFSEMPHIKDMPIFSVGV